MKFSVQNSRDLAALPSNVEAVHFVRPVPYKAIESMLKRCRSLRQISMSASTSSRLSKRARKLIEANGIDVLISAERGRAIGIPLAKMKQAIEMRQDHRALREIEQVTGIPKSTIHYLEKYSKRRKIKKGAHIIYLK